MNGMHSRQQLPVVDSGPSLGENGAEIRSLPPHRVYSIYIYIFHLALMFRWHATDEVRDAIGIWIRI